MIINHLHLKSKYKVDIEHELWLAIGIMELSIADRFVQALSRFQDPIEARRAYGRWYHSLHGHKYLAGNRARNRARYIPRPKRQGKATEEKLAAKRAEYRKNKDKYLAYNHRPEIRARQNELRRKKLAEMRLENPVKPKPRLPVEVIKSRRAEYQRRVWESIKSDPSKLAEVNERKRLRLKAELVEAKADPEKLAAIRAKRAKWAARYRENIRSNRPDKYASDLERDRIQMRLQRQKPGYWDRVNAYSRRRRQIDPAYRLSQSMRNTIASALRGRYKHGTFIELVGCTSGELVKHLERQFKKSMSWENYGNRIDCWCVDHKVPCAAFDLNDPDQQKQCFHYTNLQPMWFLENSSKSSRHEGKFHRHTLSSTQ